MDTNRNMLQGDVTINTAAPTSSETQIVMSWTLATSRPSYAVNFFNTTTIVGNTFRANFEYLDKTTVYYGCPRYSVAITLPYSAHQPKTYGEMLVLVQSGSINISGLSAREVIATVVQEGPITLTNVDSFESIVVSVNAGKISLNNINMNNETNELQIQSDKGFISVQNFVQGSIVASLSEGDISIDLPNVRRGAAGEVGQRKMPL